MRPSLLAVAMLWICACATRDDVRTATPADIWTAAPGAQLSFTSVKNGDIPVTGSFSGINADIDLSRLPQLKGTVRIALASLSTGILLRDGNVRDYFFDVSSATGASAEFGVESYDGPAFDPRQLTAAVEGKISGTLRLHGSSVPLELPVRISREGDGALIVATTQAATLSIAKLAMQEEKARMMKVCGHESVDDNVGVQFRIALRQP